jgi:hypothetical protein
MWNFGEAQLKNWYLSNGVMNYTVNGIDFRIYSIGLKPISTCLSIYPDLKDGAIDVWKFATCDV